MPAPLLGRGRGAPLPLALMLLVWLLASPLAVQAAVEAVRVHDRRPVLEGLPFGDAGPYEKLEGTIQFSFDPDNAANRRIVDLDKAPRDPSGLVRAEADLMVLQPLDPDKASGVALLEVSNRGGKASLRYFNDADTFTFRPETAADFGDGLLMRLGLTVIWVGWQFDVPEEPGRLRLRTPIATNDGDPITGLVRSDWVVDLPAASLALSHRDHWTYAAVRHDDPRTRLTVRDSREGARRLVPRNQWRFARDRNGGVVADPTHIFLEGGFKPGKIYELVYVAQDPRVVGLGLAAVRDTMAYAKNDADAYFQAQTGIAFGVSQTGRFLRHYLYQGFNVDEAGRKVFDGMLIHTAGAGRGSFNHRFAQPSRDAHRYSAFFYPTDLFPFTGRAQRDPLTGNTDGLLADYEKPGSLPKIFYTNTAYEYWGRAAALIHVSPDGTEDVQPLESERIYHFAGTQHFVEPWPLTEDARIAGSAWRGNPVDFLVNLRALLVRLMDWAAHGRNPPESRYPTLADRSLVTLGAYAFPDLPGFPAPEVAHVAYRAHYGPAWTRGIIDIEPPELGSAFPALVPQVDALGNEFSGVQNVELQVPLATYTGWSLRWGMPNSHELLDFRGCTLPLPLTEARARVADDPRPAVSALYESRQSYLESVDSAAANLVREGFLLMEDVPRVRRRAETSWHWVVGAAVEAADE